MADDSSQKKSTKTELQEIQEKWIKRRRDPRIPLGTKIRSGKGRPENDKNYQVSKDGYFKAAGSTTPDKLARRAARIKAAKEKEQQ